MARAPPPPRGPARPSRCTCARPLKVRQQRVLTDEHTVIASVTPRRAFPQDGSRATTRNPHSVRQCSLWQPDGHIRTDFRRTSCGSSGIPVCWIVEPFPRKSGHVSWGGLRTWQETPESPSTRPGGSERPLTWHRRADRCGTTPDTATLLAEIAGETASAPARIEKRKDHRTEWRSRLAYPARDASHTQYLETGNRLAGCPAQHGCAATP